MAGARGTEICLRRTDAIDATVRRLFEPFAGSGVAVAALGGYGRREMTPGSDIDLLFVHDGEAEEHIGPAVDGVLYPLWDSGVSVSHSVRTPEECAQAAASRIENLTTVLDTRWLAGPEELPTAARQAVLAVAKGNVADFGRRLGRWREVRASRFGHSGRMLEPDLKESIGGLRDLPVAGWCRAIGDGAPAAGAPDASRDDLLLIRTALHRVSGSRATLLLAEHHQAVADLLSVPPEPGWESRDVLMRDLFLQARLVDAFVTDLVAMLEGTGSPSLRIPPPVDALTYLPPWADVRGRPQRDPYHRFPVDVHLLETATEVQRLLDQPDDPLAADAVASVDHPETLLVAAGLHDIGKVGKGSHVQIGVDIARRVLPLTGIDEGQFQDVVFLVRDHLLLSDTAIRRNLEDEDLILDVAARVGGPRRLALLYLLTIADARATGPAASTPWRIGLIRDLVTRVGHVFERGQMDPDKAARLGTAREAARVALDGAAVPPAVVDAFLDQVSAGYLLWAELSAVADHARLVVPAPAPTEARVHVGAGRAPGTYGVAVGAIDRLGLLALLAGAFTLSGLSILSAQAFTTSTGVALDVFDVQGAFEHDVDAARWERFEATLRDVLDGAVDLREAVRSRRDLYRTARQDAPVSVEVQLEASDFFTVVEVGAPDRIGLLFDLADAFSRHGLDVHVAKVATYGARVIDAFYVRDDEGQKLVDPGRLEELRRALAEAASG